MTLEDAKKWFLSRLFVEPTECPCCSHISRVYERKIHDRMAKTLIEMYRFNRLYPGHWMHVENHLKALMSGLHENQRWVDRDYHKLRFWGIIEKKSGTSTDGNPELGLYRITQFGREFVEYKWSVPRITWVLNDTPLGQSDGTYAPLELTDIKKALNDDFKYDELMR